MPTASASSETEPKLLKSAAPLVVTYLPLYKLNHIRYNIFLFGFLKNMEHNVFRIHIYSIICNENFFFFNMWEADRERESLRESASIPCFTPHVPTVAGLGWGQSQASGNPVQAFHVNGRNPVTQAIPFASWKLEAGVGADPVIIFGRHIPDWHLSQRPDQQCRILVCIFANIYFLLKKVQLF